MLLHRLRTRVAVGDKIGLFGRDGAPVVVRAQFAARYVLDLEAGLLPAAGRQGYPEGGEKDKGLTAPHGVLPSAVSRDQFRWRDGSRL